MMVHWACIVAILVTMSLALARALLGPSVFDRALAVNMFGTKTVLLIAVSGFLFGRPEWLDLAIVYALVNFVGTFALLRFVKFKSFSVHSAELTSEPDLSEEPEPNG